MKVVDIAGVGAVGIRGKVPTDTAFIMATWIRSWAEGLRDNKRLRAIHEYRPKADAFFKNLDVAVVCSAENPDVIHSWACGKGNFLAWAYVPKDLRGYGMGRLAIDSVVDELAPRIWVGHPKRSELTDRFKFDQVRFDEEVAKWL